MNEVEILLNTEEIKIMQIAVELPNDKVAEKVLWFLEHLKDEGVKIIREQKTEPLDIEVVAEDDPDYQIILRGRKERIEHPENYISEDKINWD